jgi:uncharacterized protein (UPF0261 family)
MGRTAVVAGTFDTKGRELFWLADRLRETGLPVLTVDLSTSGAPAAADIPAATVAAAHPGGATAVFTGERGSAVAAMAEAFARWLPARAGVGGVIGAGGSGNTVLVTAGMRALPVGLPKLMVSTLASGQVAPFVGASDILMLHAVADIQGLNRITETVLGNAAAALAGMILHRRPPATSAARPALGLTMFGVTTPCVQAVAAALEPTHDCLVFHATGTGGRAMEALGHSGLLSGFLDITTTEVADMLAGGILACDADRFGAAIATRAPWVGAPGALDMVNFGPRDSVPARHAGRRFHIHNPAVTLMRTTVAENRAAGEWIGARMNLMQGPVRFLIPEGGVSALDAPGGPFHDPEADAALFAALEATVRPSPDRRILRLPLHINDPAFAAALVAAFREIA